MASRNISESKRLANKEYARLYREKNRDKLRAIYKKNYYKHRDKYLKKYRARYKSKSSELKEYARARRLLRKKEHNDYKRHRYETNIDFKLRSRLRGRIKMALKRDRAQKRGSAVNLLGCSLAEARVWIESQFLEGMNWENWTHDGWHLDHKKPLASFDLTNPQELAQACHFSNLQPLWSKDNLSKGAKHQ